MSNVAIVVIGNEVLEGSVTDTNSGWLCRQVSGRGASVTQICTVPDSVDRIRTALTQAALLKPNLIVTLGGLGPTRDDLTLSAISDFVGEDLCLHSGALAMVEQRYRELAAEGRITEASSPAAVAARQKMAMFPNGAQPLFNTVGAAPAMYIDSRSYGILALPGVPSEMKSIVLDSATGVFQRWVGAGSYRSASVVTSTNDESVLDAALRAFDAEATAQDVYVKSRARSFGGDVRMTVTISAKGVDHVAVEKLVHEAVRRFEGALRSCDIDIIEVIFDA